jgi:hypothetical protein
LSAEKTIYLFVNGIATWPGNFTNWNKRAVTYTHTMTPHKAEAFEYFCTMLTRPFREDERAKHFARALKEYSRLGWKIVCVGHSNGCAVILDGLRKAGWPAVEAVHLVCGACEADFNNNGLNSALYCDRVKRAFVYCAEEDLALLLAHSLPGKILGYGTLGLRGPIHMLDSVKNKVGTLWWPRFNHSDCWLPLHFRQTMQHFFAEPRHGNDEEHYGGKHLMSRTG